MQSLRELAVQKNIKLAIAESLTGGMVSASIVSEAGASDFFLGSVVSYQDSVKVGILGVSPSTLASQTAVDPEVAIQMAQGVRAKLARHALLDYDQVIGISTTGVAGPDPVGDNPVGLVYFGVSSAVSEQVVVETFLGDRQQIRQQACDKTLEIIREQLTAIKG